MISISHDSKNNLLLAALPDAEWLRWLPQLESIEMSTGQVLHEPGRAPNYAYFSTTAIMSLLHVLDDGTSAEVAIVGNDGVVDISLFMGAECRS